jgi:CheY-like chemotaxis protein
MRGANLNGKERGSGPILIVDDDPDTCLLLETLLSGKGYETAIAYNGEEAVDRFNHVNPALVVLDLMMPGMDGWAVLSKVRESSVIPVIFLSALNTGYHEDRALSLGASGYLEKPFYPSELIDRIDSLLGREDVERPTESNSLALERQRRPLTVSVVIPTYNEAENLPLVLPYLPMEGIDEVILVDGRSSDGTVDVAKRLMPSIKVLFEPTPGKGAALRSGYRAASGDIIIGMDADGSHDPREIPRIVRALLEGADFVKASRFAPQGGTTDMPRYRRMGNAAFVHLANLLFGCTFTDITYGYHAFWRNCLDEIQFDDIDGFDFEIAFYLRAVRERLRIVEVASFEGYRFSGMGKLKTIPDGWLILMRILREWEAGMRSPNRNPYRGFRGAHPDHVWMPSSAILVEAGSPSMGNGAKTNGYRADQPDEQRGSNETVHELLKQILQLSMESVGATRGSVVAVGENGEVERAFLADTTTVESLPPEQLSDTMQRGLAGWVVRTRKPALVPSTREDPRWLIRSWEEIDGAERSAVGIPVVASDQLVGAMVLSRPKEEQFTVEELERLKYISESV